jgi:copper/silver efflux system protein
VIRAVIRASAEHRVAVVALAVVAVAAGLYAVPRIPVDAVPDLADTEVIVFSRFERGPEVVEDQVTYPIVTALLGAPRVKNIYGTSDFGFSYVHVVFKDGTDPYWARSRVLEYLAKIQAQLPAGARTELGPDATGVGWVFQYALVDDTRSYSLADLRTYQDWNLRYRLQSVPGVAEVASIGGYAQQYRVTLDPDRMKAYDVGVLDVTRALRAGNREVGGRVLEFTGREYMVGGSGQVRGKADLEWTGVKTGANGVPVFVRDVAEVTMGPELRRGVADLDGRGDTVGAIVVMRQGENAREVIARVKQRLAEVAPSLPRGVRVVTTYDRSDLIHRAIDTLLHALREEMLIVSAVILLFLWHVPSAIVPIVTIPVSVLLAFLAMAALGIPANIMSLSGIAISIGVLVDGAIVEVENAYKRLENWIHGGRQGDFHAVRLQALLEVGPPVFFSLLVIAVAFLPIFTLVDQEGRLFKPLAWTKTLTLAVAALLALTLDPALRMLFTRVDFVSLRPRWLAWIVNHATVGRYHREERHPISRLLFAAYGPACRLVLRHPWATIGVAVMTVATAGWAYTRLGREFMPPLNEGTILYMPSTVPGISVTEAARLLRTQDGILAGFPEVQRVFGKAGRAETATDPAPFSMMETTVSLRPAAQWREKRRWYTAWPLPDWFKSVALRPLWPDRLSWPELVEEMDHALRIPGTTNAWTMPIRGRIDMLSTGIRTPVGVKIFGPDLRRIEAIGRNVEAVLSRVPGTRSVYAERSAGGYGLDLQPNRQALARFGMTVDEVQEAILTAVGGENVTTTTSGRARFPVSVRYPRDLSADLGTLARVPVRTPAGALVPLAQLADIKTVLGPAMIRNENGLLAGYVYVDLAGSDIGGYVERAQAEVARRVPLKPGYTLEWSGQYENMRRVRERLQVVVPLTLVLIVVLLYLNTRSFVRTGIVLMAVPFSAVGAIWLMYALGYNLSLAAWVGLIALMGLDAETGVFMLLYLDLAYAEARAQGRLASVADLQAAILQGAVKRIRPKLMTVAAAFMGLMPIMWSRGAGSDVMKRVAAPMVGGLATSFLMELLVYPALYLLWRRREARLV